jgi:PAS domain S-box-containing protein
MPIGIQPLENDEGETMRRLSFASLRMRLVFLVLVAVIPALGLTLYSGVEQRREALGHVQNDALNLARHAAAIQGNLVDNARHILFALSQLFLVGPHDPTAYSAIFANLLKQSESYSNFVAAKPDGSVLVSALPLTRPMDIADRPYFQRLLQTREFTIGEYQMGRASGKAAIAFAYPVFDDTGGLQVVLATALNLGWLNQFMANSELPAGATCTVIDRNGVILARYPDSQEFVGKAMPEEPLTKAMLAQGEGTAEAVGMDGVLRFYGFTPLENTSKSVFVRVGIPKQIAFAGANRKLARNIGLLGIAALLAFTAAWFVGDIFILRRLNRLMGAARQVADGNLHIPLGPPYRGGELGELAMTFDKMAAVILTRETETQQRSSEIAALLESARAILEYRQFKYSARRIFDSCRSVIGATAGYVALLSEDGTENKVLFLDSGGDRCKVDPKLPMPIRGLHEEAYRSGKAVYCNDFSRSEWVKLMPQGHADLENVMFAPLVIEEKAVGLLGLANKPGGFTENDAHLSSAFGELAAIALFNSQTWESLEESKERFQSLAQTANDAIVSADHSGDILFWNNAAERIFGHSAMEMIGRPVTIIMPERFRETHQNGMKRATSTGTPTIVGKTVEVVGLTKDGREFPMEISLATWRARGSVFFTGILRDISKRKGVEEELRKHSDLLEKLVAERTAQLSRANEQLQQEIVERKESEEELQLERHKLKSILDGMSDGVYVIDQQYEFEYINAALEKDFGPVNGRKCYDYFYDRTEVCLGCENQKVFAGESAQWERSYPKTGKTYELCGTPIKNLHGGISALEIFHDVTKSRLAEKERALLATAVEQAAEGVLVTDLDWTIQHINPAFQQICGYSREEIVGQHHRILKSGKHDPAFYKTMRNTFERGEAWSGRFTAKRKDGAYFEAEATISPVRDTNGNIVNWVTIGRDISYVAKLEAQLRQAQKIEAIGTLAGGIAHDFNNILGIILGYLELAMFTIPKEEEAHPHLEQVFKASNRAKDLVKQILAFSHHAEQERRPTRIAFIVEEALKMLRASLPSTIEMREDIASKSMVLADATQIHQVLINLCTNAAHALEEKGGVIGVSLLDVDLDADFVAQYPDILPGPYLKLTVSDTGHGMNAEIIERIFDPYFTTKSPGKGTGLGLSAVHGIVKSHGGIITIYSEPGKGSTFRIFLPRIESPTNSVIPSPTLSKTIPAGTECILFVDDEEELCRSWQKTLENLGYEVVTRTSSIEALEVFRAQPGRFDLVITDLTMPRMTGVDLARELLRIQRDIRVILCTGFSRIITQEMAKDMGIRELVMKPLLTNELAVTIRRVLDV